MKALTSIHKSKAAITKSQLDYQKAAQQAQEQQRQIDEKTTAKLNSLLMQCQDYQAQSAIANQSAMIYADIYRRSAMRFW